MTLAGTAQGNLATSRFDIDVNNSPKSLLDGTPTLFALEVDNSQNSVDVFLKIWDLVSTDLPTVGDTGAGNVPDMVIRVAAGTVLPVSLDADGDGLAFATGIVVACVITGGTGGSTSPTNTVTATFWAT